MGPKFILEVISRVKSSLGAQLTTHIECYNSLLYHLSHGAWLEIFYRWKPHLVSSSENGACVVVHRCPKSFLDPDPILDALLKLLRMNF